MSDATDQLVDELTVEEPKKRRVSGKLIVIAVLGLLLLAGIGFGAMTLMGGDKADKAPEKDADGTAGKARGDGADAAKAGEGEKPLPTELVFFDMPELLVNLNAGGRQTAYLKAKIALELDSGTTRQDIEAKLPRVVDEFQVYLRELRVEDLGGSAGVYRLKEELLVRINQAIAPARINDVLFKEMLVQ